MGMCMFKERSVFDTAFRRARVGKHYIMYTRYIMSGGRRTPPPIDSPVDTPVGCCWLL